jgi:hypothetical protein
VKEKKIICEDCGEPMTRVYTKGGLPLYLCMHNKAKTVMNRLGYPAYGVIPCGNAVFGLKKAFANMTQHSKLTIKQLEEATKNRINTAELLKLANYALELDFDCDTLPDVFSAAMTLGYSLGKTPQQAIETLLYGIGNKSRRRLDNIGIVVIAAEAYEWYKTKHDLKHDLVEAERDEAWQQYAIYQTIEKAKKVKGEKE